jgi:hypothetical protein
MFIAGTNRFEVAANVVSIYTALTTTGNVGIGTAAQTTTAATIYTPAASTNTNLTITADNPATGQVIVLNHNNGQSARISLRGSTNPLSYIASNMNVLSPKDINFYTNKNVLATPFTISAAGNIGIGKLNPNALLEISSVSQTPARIILSGQEFLSPSNTMPSGIALLLGVNRTGNKQLWLCDSTDLTQNATNPVLRLMPNNLDCLSTNGTLLQMGIGGNLYTGANGVNIGMNTTSYKLAATVLTISWASSGSAQPIVQITQTNAGMVITLFRLKDMLI